MSILALGDLHIQPNNLAEITIFLSQLEKHLATREKKYDLIVILGDTLHTHETLHTLCMNKMLEYLSLCERFAPTFVLVGNHEYINNAQFLSENHPYLTWKKEHQIVDRLTETILTSQGKEYRICLLPYVPDGRFHEAFQVSNRKIKDYDLIFGHQLFNRVKMGAIVAENVEDWLPEYPQMISGHIHDRQTLDNLHYPGSAMQVSFGETQDCLLSEYLLETKVILPVNIHPPKKKSIHASLPIDEKVLSQLQPEENVKLKLILSGNEEEFKTFKKGYLFEQLLARGIKIAFKQKLTQQKFIPTRNKNISFRETLHSLIAHDPDLLQISQKIFE